MMKNTDSKAATKLDTALNADGFDAGYETAAEMVADSDARMVAFIAFEKATLAAKLERRFGGCRGGPKTAKALDALIARMGG